MGANSGTVRAELAGTNLGSVRWDSSDTTSEGPLVMKQLLLTLAALTAVSLAAREEKNPVEKAADEIEDVVDEAN